MAQNLHYFAPSDIGSRTANADRLMQGILSHCCHRTTQLYNYYMPYFGKTLFCTSLTVAGLALALPGSAVGAEPGKAPARWEVNYGDASCRLTRHFGTPDQPHSLSVEREWGIGEYRWTLSGRGVPIDASETTVTILRKPSGATHDFKAGARYGGIGWQDPENHLLAALRNDEHFTISGRQNLNVEVDLPRAQGAVQTLEKCEADLISVWGLDANLLRQPSKHARPSNYPGYWVTNDDYPRDDFIRKNEGITSFRLLIGADGSVKGCRITDSSGFPSLDRRTCELLLARAAFHPATDDAGKALLDTYSNRVSWKTPR
ncbi:MAG: energy transducer TonB [Sphingopyxis sp.]